MYADAALLAAEREHLLRPAWQLLGHAGELSAAGDFVCADLAGERVMVVRGERGRVHALRNTCRQRPHALVSARKGHLKSAIHCAAHGLTYSFDGRLVEGATPGDLAALELAQPGRLLLVRAGGGAATQPVPPGAWQGFEALLPGEVTDLSVAADWKLIVEQWLESPRGQQHFVSPNQLLDIHPAGAVILQVVPSAPGRSRIRRFDFSVPRAGGKYAAWRRNSDAWLAAQIELAESTHSGLMGAAEDHPDAGAIAPALAQFRGSIAALLQALPAR